MKRKMLPTVYYIELENGVREYRGPIDLVMALEGDFAPRVGDLWIG